MNIKTPLNHRVRQIYNGNLNFISKKNPVFDENSSIFDTWVSSGTSDARLDIGHFWNFEIPKNMFIGRRSSLRPARVLSACFRVVYDVYFKF